MSQQEAQRPVIILGATGGIGQKLARRLADGGVPLVLAARTEDRLNDLADELDATAVRADATSFEEVESLVKGAGDIGGAVNLVGSMLLKPAHLTSQEDLEQTLALNLTSAFALVRAAAQSMRNSGGSIVVMSSCAARVGLSNHEAIAAAKAGVEALARSAAASYASSGIRINAVAPGLVDTPLASRITSNKSALEASRAMHPLGRIGSADEIARMIEWLLTEDSSWITGQTFGIDGGLATVRARSA